MKSRKLIGSVLTTLALTAGALGLGGTGTARACEPVRTVTYQRVTVYENREVPYAVTVAYRDACGSLRTVTRTVLVTEKVPVERLVAVVR